MSGKKSTLSSLLLTPQEAEEIEWEKACEAERNFEKAVDMATEFFPVQTAEDRKFMEKNLFFPRRK